MSRGLIFAWLEIPAAIEDEFNRWYNAEHVPEREAVPGVLYARRFVADTDGPRYLATYVLEDPAVLQSPAYLSISWNNVSAWSREMNRQTTYLHRNVYQEIGSSSSSPLGDRPQGHALLVECASVAAEQDAAFNAWYDNARLPALLAIPGFRAASRFSVIPGQRQFKVDDRETDVGPHAPGYYTADGEPKYVTLYELDDVSVLSSAAYRQLMGTPMPIADLRSWGYSQIYPALSAAAA